MWVGGTAHSTADKVWEASGAPSQQLDSRGAKSSWFALDFPDFSTESPMSWEPPAVPMQSGIVGHPPQSTESSEPAEEGKSQRDFESTASP